MTAQAPNTIGFYRATYVGASGATGAASYQFLTKDYKPPAQQRSIDLDIVHNQNGKFKWVYDNGPGWKQWQPFKVVCGNTFQALLGLNAAQQYANLLTLWEHPGLLTMFAPEASYTVHWSSQPIERNFIVFPSKVGDSLEYEIAIQLEEG